MRTFADAEAQLRGAEAGGFAVSQAQAASLLNEGVRRLAAASEWIKAELDLGPTIDGQEQYVLPNNVVKLRGIAVAGQRYARTELLTLWEWKVQGYLPADAVGAYAERFSEDGKVKTFSLLPIPDGALPISGLAAITPADDLSGDDVLPFPEEYNRAVLNFAKGIAYEDLDENPQSATYFIERLEKEGAELKLKGYARTGAGPTRLPVAGLRRR